MKTEYSKIEVAEFLQTTGYASPDTLERLTEGHVSQALSYETIDGQKMVIRIAPKNADFLHDKFAYDMLGENLPIPEVLDIGIFQESSYYCISKWMPGEQSNKISEENMQESLHSAQDTFASIFKSNISSTSGYGEIDLVSSNGKNATWKEALEEWKRSLVGEDEDSGLILLRDEAEYVGLDPDLINRFLVQYYNNFPFASETRRLYQGDPGFDNMLIKGGQVTAVIDWAEMGYGDWARDFARLDFWWPGRYGEMAEFANKYDLESENLTERKALYWALIGLGAIKFAAKTKSQPTIVWWRDNIVEKLI